MANPKNIKWLEEEIAAWEQAGLISAEQAKLILQRYPEPTIGEKNHLGKILIGLLATLFISGGIILIIAYNWELLSKSWKTVISFLPLLLGLPFYAYAYLKKSDQRLYTESASSFLMLMLLATFSMISQTYHIYNDPAQFLWIWLLICIPIIYWMSASVTAIIFSIGIIALSFQTGESEVWKFWLLVIAVAPHYIQRFKIEHSFAKTWLGWTVAIGLPIAWLASINLDDPAYVLGGLAAFIALFYLWTTVYFEEADSWLKRPLGVAAIIGGLLLTIMLTYDLNFPKMTYETLVIGEDIANFGRGINFMALILLLIAGIYFAAAGSDLIKWQAAPILILPLFVILYIVLQQLDLPLIAIILANIYLFGWGIIYLIQGIRTDQMALINAGMLILVLFLSLRFFDTNWSFLVKGVCFMLLGGGFWYANWRLSKYLELKRAEELIDRNTLT